MFTESLTLLSSALRTGTGVSDVVDLAAYRTAVLTLDVTAKTGTTPSLAVTLESATTATPVAWITLGSFAAATTVSQQANVRFPGSNRYLRAKWVITGSASPSFTFSVSGERRLVYCDPADVRGLTLPADTLVDNHGVAYSDSALGAFSEDATDDVDDVFGTRFELPLERWGRTTRKRAAEIAAFYAVRARGGQPSDPGFAVIVAMKDGAVGWLTMAQRNEIMPVGVVDATPDIEDSGAEVVTSGRRRGWGLGL